MNKTYAFHEFQPVNRFVALFLNDLHLGDKIGTRFRTACSAVVSANGSGRAYQLLAYRLGLGSTRQNENESNDINRK